MNKAQAKRLANWVNGIYLTQADHTGFSDAETALLGDEDQGRVQEAKHTIGHELIARSGIPLEATFEQALALVLGNQRIDG